MGLFGGMQVKTNMAELSVECHSMDCSGDSKVLTELQIAIRSKLLSKVKRIEKNIVYIHNFMYIHYIHTYERLRARMSPRIFGHFQSAQK